MKTGPEGAQMAGANLTQYVVTLVHGTWARRSKWTQDGSVLCQVLHRLLPGEVSIHRLEWSGAQLANGPVQSGKAFRNNAANVSASTPSSPALRRRSKPRRTGPRNGSRRL